MVNSLAYSKNIAAQLGAFCKHFTKLSPSSVNLTQHASYSRIRSLWGTLCTDKFARLFRVRELFWGRGGGPVENFFVFAAGGGGGGSVGGGG